MSPLIRVQTLVAATAALPSQIPEGRLTANVIQITLRSLVQCQLVVVQVHLPVIPWLAVGTLLLSVLQPIMLQVEVQPFVLGVVLVPMVINYF